MNFTHCSGVSIVYFGHVSTDWGFRFQLFKVFSFLFKEK